MLRGESPVGVQTIIPYSSPYQMTWPALGRVEKQRERERPTINKTLSKANEVQMSQLVVQIFLEYKPE